MIELQQKLLGDNERNEAFFQALKRVVKKGQTVVADVGSGTGFLSFLAIKLGAKKCYLYESDEELLELSRSLAQRNGVKNCEFFAKHSAQIKNPPKADIVLSETLGNYALEENILETLQDAKRFLKPGGIMIPEKLAQFAAPVAAARVFEEINVWDRVGFRLDFSAAKEKALNNMYVAKIEPGDLLENGRSAQKWDGIDFSSRENSVRRGSCEWRMRKSASIFGFVLWWEAELVPGIRLSTSPFHPHTHWDQIFLPLLQPMQAKNNDTVEVHFVSDSRWSTGINLSWDARLLRAGKEVQRVAMDMKKG